MTGFPLFHPKSEVQQLSPGLSQFLDSGSPPVVFTAGTDTQSSRAFFEAVLRAIQELGIRAVFLTRLTEQLPKLPAAVWHESYTSLQQLLPRASAVVHHGGIGTTAQALRAGTPQLIVPVRMDQLDNGEHIERLGCGEVQRGSFNSGSVAEKLRRLLTSPQIRTACDRMQSQLEPGTKACSRAADVIEEVFYGAGKVVECA